MSEPYEAPFKRCVGCEEDVLLEEWDKETGYCKECLKTDAIEDRANDYD